MEADDLDTKDTEGTQATTIKTSHSMMSIASDTVSTLIQCKMRKVPAWRYGSIHWSLYPLLSLEGLVLLMLPMRAEMNKVVQ